MPAMRAIGTHTNRNRDLDGGGRPEASGLEHTGSIDA